MNKKIKNYSAFMFGGGAPSRLGFLFVGLKIADVIDWDWLWILAPFWMPSLAFLAYWGFKNK